MPQEQGNGEWLPYSYIQSDGVWEEYLDLRGRKWWEAGEDCIMRSFITCTLHHILLG
jgi:hypothetical protein